MPGLQLPPRADCKLNCRGNKPLNTYEQAEELVVREDVENAADILREMQGGR